MTDPFEPTPRTMEAPRGYILGLVTMLFFLSGAAGLVYQVLWMRTLGLFFGSDMYGVSIILATFMGGLALGSFAGGRLAEATPRPLVWYGLAELGIGVFALLLPTLLGIYEPLLHRAYPAQPNDPSALFQATRFLLAAGSLLVPTTLMGATLPLILRHFARSVAAVGKTAAYFYAANTLGALAGTLAAGFLLLPYFGMEKATLCTVFLNLGIGICCILMGRRLRVPDEMVDSPKSSAGPSPGPTHFEASQQRALARTACIAFGISGFAAFALEVVWTRVLRNTMSATVYSFTVMLACFLFGIFLGSLLVAGKVDRERDPIRLFAGLELAIAASVMALGLSMNLIPGVFGRTLGGMVSGLGMPPSQALLVSTLVTSFVLLVVPTTLIGATFAVALRIYTTRLDHVSSHCGNLLAANTAGAILGSLTAAFLLVPALGASGCMALIALLFAANGTYLAFVGRRSGISGAYGWRLRLPLAITALGAVLVAWLPYSVTLNFGQEAGKKSELLYRAEGVQNTIDILRSASGTTSLIIGGNVEADDSFTQRRHFVLKGHLPLMLLEHPASVLVIGLGMGITLEATARHEGVERIDVIELSPEVVEAQAALRSINGDILADPKIHVRIDDGRNFVRMTNARYDMITADPIHPKISRVGYLYTKEYYEAIRDLLEEDGIVCQWMPIYQIAPLRLRSAVRSFVEVFPNATVWYVKNHALFVAQRNGRLPDFEVIAKAFAKPRVQEDLGSIGIDSTEDLLALLLMGPEEIEDYLSSDSHVPLNTDDHPYLEYFVPGDLFFRPIDNIEELVRHLSDPTQLLTHQPAASANRVRELIRGRKERLMSELERPSPTGSQ